MAYPLTIQIMQTADFSKEINPLPIYGYFETKTNLVYYYNVDTKNWVTEGFGSGGGGGGSSASFSSLTGQPSDNTSLNTTLNNKEDKTNKNQNSGYAGLDANGKLSATQIPVLPDYRPIKLVISTNGQVNFTIPTAPVNLLNPFLFLNGILQVLGTVNSDYNISSNLLVWTSSNIVLETTDELIFYYK